MSFRNDAQRNRCCMILCARIMAPRKFWSHDGPSIEASELARMHTDRLLSPSEITLLRVAFDFYNGDGRVLLKDILEKLNERHRIVIAELLIAETRGSVWIEHWIKRWENKP